MTAERGAESEPEEAPRARRPRRRRRVPVVLQQEARECAAACLAMVLGFHGRPTRLVECRERCGAGRDGTTMRALAEAARSFGLRARGFASRTDAGSARDLATVDLPAIIFWRFGHFLVVERVTGAGVDVVDPAKGRERLSHAEFDEGFTGLVLALEPGPHFDRRAARGGFSWPAYLRYLLATRGVWGALAQVLAASLVLQAAGIALPFFTKVVVDDVLPHGLESALAMLGLGMVVVVLAQALTSYLRAALLVVVQGRLDARIMLGFFEHLLSLPYRFFQRRTSGDLLMRLSSNMVVREVLTSQTTSAVFDGTLVVGYLVVLLAWEPAFGAAVVALGLVQGLVLVATTRALHGLMVQDLETQARSQSWLVEALAGVETLKASGGEERALERWSDLFFAHLNVSMRRGRASAWIESGMQLLRALSPLVLLWLGARFVLDGRMSLGSMLALNALAASFLAPLASLVANGQALQLVGAHLERIGDVLAAAPEQAPGEGAPVETLAGRLELERVSFRYDPDGPPVLRDVSLVIEPGSKVALVGRTGSGKSTLGKLLLGLYRPDAGRVLVDGLEVGGHDLRALRRRFGVVLQESHLFGGSVRENIAFLEPDLTLEEVEHAARLAEIHADVAAMPMGYETRLSEGGAGLSGGQRQRLSIARALATAPRVLLLDEATSHLDAVTESRVDANLSRLDCTRVVIAHRTSTVRNADLVVVLDEGAIVERGTHAELVALDGHYARLVGERPPSASHA